MASKSGLLISFLLVILITGCRQRSTEIYDLFGNESSQEKLEKVTLTVYVPGGESPYAEEVFSALEKRTEKELNIRLEPVFFDRNGFGFLGDIENILQQSDSCDLVYIAGINGSSGPFGGGDVLESLYQKGLIQDLTGLFRQLAPDYYNSLDSLAIQPYRREGRLLAVPNYVISANRPSAIVRKDFFQSYNLTAINSIASFEDYLDLVLQNEPENITPLVVSDNLSLMSIFANAYGYAILDEELQLVYRWDDPEMRIFPWEDIPEYGEILERAQSWFLKGYIKRGELFAEQYLFMDTPGWGAWISDAYSSYDFNRAAAASGQDFRYQEFPLFPEARAQRINRYYQGFALSANSEQGERAMAFIEWVHRNQENYDLVHYGVEGKHYQLDEGRLVLPEKISREDAFRDWEAGALRDMRYERFPAGDGIGGDLDKYRKTYLEQARFAPHGGFVINRENMDTFSRRKSYKQMDEGVSRGQINPSTLAEFRERQKKEGVKAIVQAAQSQLNQWLETEKENE